MRRIMIATLAAALGVLTGCGAVLSRNPLYPENAKEVVFDPALLGKWQDVTNKDKTVYEIARLDESAYFISFEDHGKPETATMELLKVGAFSMLDVCFRDDGAGGDAGPSKHYFTRHLFARIRIEPDTVHLAALGSKWLKERILATGKPAHTQAAEGDDPVLTAPSAELQQTLIPYLDHPEAFGDETELRRVK